MARTDPAKDDEFQPNLQLFSHLTKFRDDCAFQAHGPYPLKDPAMEKAPKTPSPFVDPPLPEGVSREESYKHLVGIPHLEWGDPRLQDYFRWKQPCVIKNAQIVQDTVKGSNRWTPEYLLKKLKYRKLNVYECRQACFRNWYGKKNYCKYPFNRAQHTTQRHMTMGEFLDQSNANMAIHKREMEEKGSKDHRSQGRLGAPYLYLQQCLGECVELVLDFSRWNWEWILLTGQRHDWGQLENNNLFVGMAGAWTNAHFDEQENIVCQVSGRKEVILHHPRDWENLYAFPWGHPYDQQTMVDRRNPDWENFPKFKYTRPHRVVLNPGDALYLPAMWWHEFSNIDELAMSVTFWSPRNPPDMAQLQLPLSDSRMIDVRRNCERMVASAVGNEHLPRVMNDVLAKNENGMETIGLLTELLKSVMPALYVPAFLVDMLHGRYDVPAHLIHTNFPTLRDEAREWFKSISSTPGLDSVGGYLVSKVAPDISYLRDIVRGSKSQPHHPRRNLKDSCS